MGNVGHRACCCGCLRDLCRTDLQSNEEAAQQKNAGRRRDGGICRCNSGSPSDCADTDAALKIFNPSAAWSTTRRSLPTQSVVGEYIGCQKKLMLSNGESMSFLVCRYGQPLMWSAFYLRFHLNVSFFKEQGECREAACAERQPKCGGKIIARFGVVRRAWGCGRHGSRYGCGSCRRCPVGSAVGVAVGSAVGVAVGSAVGVAVGSAVGVAVGSAVGVAVGSAVGVAVGSTVGVAVGSGVGVSSGAAMVKVFFMPSLAKDTEDREWLAAMSLPALSCERKFMEPVTAVTL